MNIRQLTQGIGKLMEGNICILSGLRIQVVQPKYGPTVGFRGILASRIVHIIIVIEYLAVGPDSVPGDWVVVLGMYVIHLKQRQCLYLSNSITEDHN